MDRLTALKNYYRISKGVVIRDPVRWIDIYNKKEEISRYKNLVNALEIGIECNDKVRRLVLIIKKMGFTEGLTSINTVPRTHMIWNLKNNLTNEDFLDLDISHHMNLAAKLHLIDICLKSMFGIQMVYFPMSDSYKIELPSNFYLFIPDDIVISSEIPWIRVTKANDDVKEGPKPDWPAIFIPNHEEAKIFKMNQNWNDGCKSECHKDNVISDPVTGIKEISIKKDILRLQSESETELQLKNSIDFILNDNSDVI